MSTTRSASPREPATEPPDRETTLLLVAHGAGPGSAAAVRHAAAIAELERFAAVRTACLKGAPGLEETLAEIASKRVVLLPLLMAEGYSYDMLSRRATAVRPVALCRPVGASSRLATVMAAMAQDCCRDRGWAPSDSAVVLVGHGTARHAASSATAEAQVAHMAAAKSFARVAVAFLEAPPDLPQVLVDLAPLPTVIVGFFADRGVHGDVDVPRLIAAAGVPAVYAGPVGDRPELVEVLLAQLETARQP